MLIHQLVLKGDLKELKKEIAKDIGQFTTCFNLLPQKYCTVSERASALIWVTCINYVANFVFELLGQSKLIVINVFFD